MKGGVILFRGNGTAARRYLEADRSQADDYYLEAGTVLASFAIADHSGAVIAEAGLSPDEYAGWVDWTHPLTGESMGTPRLPGEGRRGSPRFAEMVVNAPKSLSIAAALHADVSDALDAAQADAVAEIRRWLAQHSVTRVGPRGMQEVVPVEALQTVAVTHRTSRAGDPHRHVHFQIGTRVQAAGAWRALDTAALFKQQGAIRALGTAVIAASPGLTEVLDRHGLTLDPIAGEVIELAPFNQAMSKRSAQVHRNLARIEAEWQQAHPGETPGPVVRAKMQGEACAFERPNKPEALGSEDAWRAELAEAGYDPAALIRRPAPAPVALDDLRVQEVANRALDRCAAGASAWTRHTVQEHVTRITTEHGVRATPDGRDYLDAVADKAAATERLHTTGRLGRRRAEHDHQAAQAHTETARGRLRASWGTVPANDQALTEWAAQAADRRAEHDPHVTDADNAMTDAKAARESVTERQRRERLALLARLHGTENVRRDPIRYQLTANTARAEAARLRALPPDQAARQIAEKQAASEAARRAETERARRLRTTPQEPATTRDPRRDGPDLGR